MKRVFLFATAVILSATVFAQAKKAEDVIKFKELAYDFGKIKQGTPVKHDFVFTNISNSPVIIESAVPSCGCTTPFKPEGAIQKGKDDKITAEYNAAAVGTFNKNITIKVAGVDEPLQLKITGEVLTPDAYAKYEASKGKSGR
ncbi:MAG TPA: DUF1573 domain-containing protein [Puia sp.]|nr:DUF1573 domain-containing protein [Puia sp.]